MAPTRTGVGKAFVDSSRVTAPLIMLTVANGITTRGFLTLGDLLWS